MRIALLLILLASNAAAAQVADATVAPAEQSTYPTVRELVFVGNRTTQPKTLLREMVIQVGDPADPERIEQSRQGIQNLGLFRSVKVEQEPLAEGLRLKFVVKEKVYILPLPRGDVNSDGGYGYGAQLRWDNIWGLNHAFRGYWERRQSAEGDLGETRGLQTRYQFIYNAPYLFDTFYNLDLALGRFESPIVEPVAFDETFTFVNTTLRRKLDTTPGSQGWTVGGALGWGEEDTSGPDAPPPYGQATGLAVLADYKNLRYNVHSEAGEVYGLRLDTVTEGLGSDYHVLQYTGYFQEYRYIGTTPHQTLNSFAYAGVRHGGPPRNPGFQLGGNDGLRGFDPEIAEGDAFYRVGLEFLRPVFRRSIRALAVIEAGNAFAEPGDIHFDEVLVSVGLGLRVRLQAFVNIDVEFGVAYPIGPKGEGPRLFATKI